MQLVSFQIKECFGFRDSGRINLQDPTNLIHILGHNSSGKTSFLTALAHFDRSLIPLDYPNFVNFDPSSDSPSLICEYRVNADDLSLETFQTDFYQAMLELNKGNTIGTASDEYKKITANLIENLSGHYVKVIEEVKYEGSLWVRRNGSGGYLFSTQSSFQIANKRITEELPALIARIQKENAVTNNQLRTGSGFSYTFYTLTPAKIENLLAYLLPTITWFNKAYSHLDILPDTIKPEHLTQSPNSLTTTLIEYLGKTKLERLLKGQNPRERNTILAGMRGKINALINEVNKDRPAGAELPEIDLSRTDGLQITVTSSDKFSFYKNKLKKDFGIPDESIYEVAVPKTQFPEAKGSGIEDGFSKADFAKLLAHTGNTPEAEFEALSNSEYMKRKEISKVPKRVVAHEFNKCITSFNKDDFEEETLSNMCRILDFCMNDDWFSMW